MAYDKFLIAPLDSGLRLDLKPWMISNDSYAQLDNAYMFRGRVVKRFGSKLMGSGAPTGKEQLHSRLRINIGVIGAGGQLNTALPGALGYTNGMAFSMGSTMFTVFNPLPGLNPMYSTTPTIGASFNNANNQVVINAAVADAGTDVYFYPSEPVMGLTQFGPNSAINDKPAYAFDTQFAYLYGGGFWSRSRNTAPSNDPLWHGSDINFFWTCNWEGIVPATKGYEQAMFVTNFQVANPNGVLVAATDDNIWALRTVTSGTNIWEKFLPYFLPDPGAIYTLNSMYVSTARIIVAFKNRLVLLNTIETTELKAPQTNQKTHVNRARWCHNGSPFSHNAWYEGSSRDNSGNVGDGGGYLDASTDEAIISAEFIKDRLIVFFERSTWELAYTDNELQPFLWQKINTELGCQSTFSSVPFDQFVLSVGQTGVHGCSGANVERIDSKIPDEVFKIQNPSGGSARVHGVRDYYTEMVYWCFPKSDQPSLQPYPQRVLVYNYQNKSWAFNDDSITCFGYFEQQTAPTWASMTMPWNQTHATWDSGTLQANFRQVIAGNQEGFTFIIDSDTSRNAPVMQITNLTYALVGGDTVVTLTVINHNLRSTVTTLSQGDYVLLENIVTGGASNIATILNGTIHEVSASTADPNTFSFTLEDITLTGVYRGAGTVTRVSNINIKSREWNPYIDKGKNVLLSRIDFAVARTNNGEITVDYSPSSATNMSMIRDSNITGCNLGTNVLETHPYPGDAIEQQSNRLWHSVYFQGQGECVQIFMYMSDTQMRDPLISLEDFEMEGLVLNTLATSEFIQSGGM